MLLCIYSDNEYTTITNKIGVAHLTIHPEQ